MDKILVTGGAGFIGSHLVKELVMQGYDVTVTDILLQGNKLDKSVQKNIRLFRKDVRDKESMIKLSRKCKYIFHFAAVLGVDVVAKNPVETMETESIGTRNIAHAARMNGVEKIIYASTSGIYGHSAIERSVTENIHVDPRTSYAIAKRFNEIYLAALFEENGLESISLRFFNIYGSKQDDRMVIPRFFRQALMNKPITVYGNGLQTRDFTYIADSVHASIELAREISGCEIFNIANEKEIPIKVLAEQIIGLTGSKSEISFIRAPEKRYDFEVERRCGNCDKLFNAIGYKPNTPLQDGLMSIYTHLSKTIRKR